MQCLVITDKFYPHRGGSSVYWTEILSRCPAEQIGVVTTNITRQRENLSIAGLDIYRVPYIDIPKLRMPLVWLEMFARTLPLLARTRLIHYGQLLENGTWAPLLRKPYTITLYGEEISTYALRYPPLVGMFRRRLERAAAVVAISQFSVGLARKLLNFHGPIDVIHPGVDLGRFQPGSRQEARARLGLGEGRYLLTVARMLPRKGHQTVFEAMAALRERWPDLTYLVAGGGPIESALRQKVEAMRLGDRVRFLGKVPDEQLPDYYRAADLFVHPNRNYANDVEGFGIVFLEANACGLPVLGGRDGGVVEAVADGRSGYLVDPTSARDLTQRLEQLLASPEQLNALAAGSRAWAERFSWESSAQQWWALNERLLS